MFFITGCANHGTLLFVNSYATVLRVAIYHSKRTYFARFYFAAMGHNLSCGRVLIMPDKIGLWDKLMPKIGGLGAWIWI